MEVDQKGSPVRMGRSMGKIINQRVDRVTTHEGKVVENQILQSIIVGKACMTNLIIDNM
jgi:hypothetical protein